MALVTNWVSFRTRVTPAPGLVTKLNELSELVCLKDTLPCVCVCFTFGGISECCITSEHGSVSLCVCLSLVSVSIWLFSKYLSGPILEGCVRCIS